MIEEHIVKELREMFLDGATPSRLMLHVQLNHPEEETLHFLIKDYFERAFRLPLVREVRPGDDYTTPSLDHAHFNRDLVHEMVSKLDEWNTEDLSGSWLKDVSERSRKNIKEIRQELASKRFAELDRVWDELTDDERNFIIGRIAHKDFLWFKVNTLSRLVERLQQKIVELESLVEIQSN